MASNEFSSFILPLMREYALGAEIIEIVDAPLSPLSPEQPAINALVDSEGFVGAERFDALKRKVSQLLHEEAKLVTSLRLDTDGREETRTRISQSREDLMGRLRQITRPNQIRILSSDENITYVVFADKDGEPPVGVICGPDMLPVIAQPFADSDLLIPGKIDRDELSNISWRRTLSHNVRHVLCDRGIAILISPGKSADTSEQVIVIDHKGDVHASPRLTSINQWTRLPSGNLLISWVQEQKIDNPYVPKIYTGHAAEFTEVEPQKDNPYLTRFMEFDGRQFSTVELYYTGNTGIFSLGTDFTLLDGQNPLVKNSINQAFLRETTISI